MTTTERRLPMEISGAEIGKNGIGKVLKCACHASEDPPVIHPGGSGCLLGAPDRDGSHNGQADACENVEQVALTIA